MPDNDRGLRALVASVDSSNYDRPVYRRKIWRTGPNRKPRPIFEYWVDHEAEDPNDGDVKALGTVREFRRKFRLDVGDE